MRKYLIMIAVLVAAVTPMAFFTFGFKPKVNVSELKPPDDGWWEVQDGILAKWCSTKHKCPDTPGMLKNTHRLHVWCKDSDCGNILAYVNIYDGKIIIANESAQGIADRGDQLILSFTTNATGTAARLVRFQATGGTNDIYPLILRIRRP